MLSARRLLALLTTFFFLGIVLAAEEPHHSSPTIQTDSFHESLNYVPPPPTDSRLPWKLTNGERLRLGLPLKRPRFAKRIEPPSPSPEIRRAYIQLVDSNGNSKGYVSKSPNSTRRVRVTTDMASALVIQYNAAASSAQNFGLHNGEGAFAAYPNLIAVIGPASAGNELRPGSFNYAFLAAGNETPSNSVPVSGATSYSSTLAHESAIFVVSASGDLTIQWVNPDGSKPSTYFTYGSNDLTFTGDVTAFQTLYGNNRLPVFMKLVVTS